MVRDSSVAQFQCIHVISNNVLQSVPEVFCMPGSYLISLLLKFDKFFHIFKEQAVIFRTITGPAEGNKN